MLASVMPLCCPRIREIESARSLLHSLSNRNLFFCAVTFVRRANGMRFYMLVANQKSIAMTRESGITTYLYTNDADQNLASRSQHAAVIALPRRDPAAAPSFDPRLPRPAINAALIPQG